MAVRGWGGSVATAIGVAAGVGAAQLGLGYGLGIVAWLPAADGASEAAWVASLTWASWIAATSTIAGAIVAQRLGDAETRYADARRAGRAPQESPAGGSTTPSVTGTLWRIALAVAAAVGGLVTVALVAVPARAATRADTFSPQTIAAGYAVIGVMIGLIIAVWALHSPAVERNILATICWLWLVALIAVMTGVAAGRGLGTAQLGVWQISTESDRFWFRDYFYWPGAALALGSALLIGALAARTAARLPHARVGAAVSGIVGPLLVAVAYFLAAPRLIGIQAEQMSAHLMAPYAVIAGLAGSALVAGLAQRREFVEPATATARAGVVGQDSDPVAADRYRSAEGPADQYRSGEHRAGEESGEPSSIPRVAPSAADHGQEPGEPGSGEEPGPATTSSRRGISGRGLLGRIGRQRRPADEPADPSAPNPSADEPAAGEVSADRQPADTTRTDTTRTGTTKADSANAGTANVGTARAGTAKGGTGKTRPTKPAAGKAGTGRSPAGTGLADTRPDPAETGTAGSTPEPPR